MIRTVAAIGYKNLGHRKGRSILTLLGIGLGVGILLGVLVSADTARKTLENLTKDFAGKADILVGRTDELVPGVIHRDLPLTSKDLEALTRSPGVSAAIARVQFSASIRKREKLSDVQVLGVDLASDPKIYTYALAEGRLPKPGSFEVILPRRLAQRLDLSMDDELELTTATGLRTMSVVGILRDRGVGLADDGQAVFMSLDVAQVLYGQQVIATEVSLVLKPGEDSKVWIRDHGKEFAGLGFVNVSQLGHRLDGLVHEFHSTLAFVSSLALFVGGFLIYMTLTMSVVERTRVYGMMRAVGMTRGQLRWLVISEAFALAIGGALVGLLVGIIAATITVSVVSRLFDVEIAAVTLSVRAVAAATSLGIFLTLMFALIPAIRASRLTPVGAIRGSQRLTMRASHSWKAAPLLTGVGLFATVRPHDNDVLKSIGVLAILLGSVLLVPPVTPLLAKTVGLITRRVESGLGKIVLLHLSKEKARSGYTLALLMVTLAAILANGTARNSVRLAMDKWLDRQFGADLVIGHQKLMPGLRFPRSFEDKLSAQSGIQSVAPLSYELALVLSSQGSQWRPVVMIIDPKSYFDVETFLWSDGTESEARAALSDNGVLLSEQFAKKLRTGRGHLITVRTHQGLRKFRVAATYQGFLGPEVVLGLAAAQKYLRVTGPNQFHVKIDPRFRTDKVAMLIQRNLGGEFAFVARSPLAIKSEARSTLNRFSNIFLAVVFVAALVGILGLANTLTVSILERRREIGVLRALGASNAQEWRTVWVEASTLGAVAFLLALPLGWLLSTLALRDLNSRLALLLPASYPWAWIPFLAFFTLTAAGLAAALPARRVARLPIVESIRFE